MKKYFYVGIILTLILILAACGGDDNSSEGDSEEKLLTLATGDSGGTFFALGGGLANIYSDLEGYTVNSQSTKGSEVNIDLIEENKAQIGFSNTSIAYYGATGAEMFDKKTENVQGMAEIYPMYYQFVARDGSGIDSVDDIKGKKIAVGEKGSGTEANVKQLLEGWDITYEDFEPSYISFSSAVDQMKDKAVDGAFIGAGIPTSAATDLISSGDAKLIPMEHENLNALIDDKYPFFDTGKIPKGTYPDQEEDIETATINTSLVVNKDLSEDTVYELTKTLYENLDELESTHDIASEIKLKDATEGMSIKIHPGAKKYYEEEDVDIPEEVQ